MPVSLPRRPEIDHHTIKLIVGVVALSLGPLTTLLAGAPLASISDSYYAGGWSQSIFIGFLFATSAFLLAYNGEAPREMVAAKIASAAGLGVALFPCACAGHPEIVPHVHYASAAVMFAILAYLCYSFYRRAIVKRHTQARVRAGIYAVCGGVIVIAILVLALDGLTHGALKRVDPQLTFHGEYAGLLAFGISWLTASRVLPVLTRRDERISLV